MNLPSLVADNTIEALLKAASRSPEGCFVEVGVYKGGTAQHLTRLAEEQGRQIYLYDTFKGQPYAGSMDKHPVGDFGDTDYETVKNALPYAHVIQGIFPQSAVPMPPVGFVHLDCDQYQSVKEASIYLIPKLVKGASIWFDDAPYLEGARVAVEEIFGKRAFRTASGQMMVTL